MLSELFLVDKFVIAVKAYAIIYNFSVAEIALLVAVHGVVDQKLLLRLTFTLFLSLFDNSLLFQVLSRLSGVIHLNFDDLIVFCFFRLVIFEIDALLLLLIATLILDNMRRRR